MPTLSDSIHANLIIEGKRLAGENPAPPFEDKIYNFFKEVVITVKDKLISWVKGIYQHWESITVLTLSSYGLSALLSELPFYFILPIWIESGMFIPVISVLIIWGLMKLAEWRSNRRELRMT